MGGQHDRRPDRSSPDRLRQLLSFAGPALASPSVSRPSFPPQQSAPLSIFSGIRGALHHMLPCTISLQFPPPPPVREMLPLTPWTDEDTEAWAV